MDRHALFAVTPSGLAFRVGRPVKWDRAVARWYRADDRRRAGRAFRVRHDGRSYPVAAFEVRAVDRDGRGLGSERHAFAFPVPFRAMRLIPAGI